MDGRLEYSAHLLSLVMPGENQPGGKMIWRESVRAYTRLGPPLAPGLPKETRPYVSQCRQAVSHSSNKVVRLLILTLSR